jgi:sulfate transport system permease protein
MSARGLREPPAAKALLIVAALVYVALMLLLPLGAVLFEALRKGWEAWFAAVSDPDARASIRLTLIVAAISVPLNTIFGLAAAWAIAKFDFRGKTALVALIEIPFSVSPVVSGLVFVLLFGAQGWFGSWLDAHDIRIIFALPGLVLATLFVTFPFVARQLVPLMTAQGAADEEAALTLVVSGHIRGETNTMPLQVEALYNDYDFVAAFAVASLLALLALVTLALKSALEWRYRGELAAAH